MQLAGLFCSFLFNGVATLEKLGTNRRNTLQTLKKDPTSVRVVESLCLHIGKAVAEDSSSHSRHITCRSLLLFFSKNGNFFTLSVTVVLRVCVFICHKCTISMFSLFAITAMSSKYTSPDCHFTDSSTTSIASWKFDGAFFRSIEVCTNWKSPC